MVELGKNKTQPEETKICRLCFSHGLNAVNIFDDQTLENQLFDLFQITYVKLKVLPNYICQECLKMVSTFSTFKEDVKKRESELQILVRRCSGDVTNESTDQRPGLNGCSGVFDPEEDCMIIEIDPDQEYETSDDDFSMESDSESDNTSEHLQNTRTSPTTASPQKSNTTQNENVNTTEEKTMNVVDVQSKNQSSHTSPMFKGSVYVEQLNVDHTSKTYLCQYCDVAFTVQADCIEHESSSHDISNPFVCNFCPFRISNRQGLITHIKELHDAERPYVCGICVKGFCRRSDLKKHTIVHTGVRPFKCPLCSKSFSRNTNLTKHVRIHSSIKPHVCQVCPRSFTTSNDLMRHARSHTDSQPFKCNRCSASFGRKDKLNLHMQEHFRRSSELNSSSAVENIVGVHPNGEHETSALNVFNNNGTTKTDPYRHSILAAQLQQRPAIQKMATSKQQNTRLFTCSICSKSFTRERDLQSHQALHLDSLFNCKHCGIGFNRREKLLRHEQEQHVKQYNCNVCSTTFFKEDELNVHLKMHQLQQSVAINSETLFSPSAFGASTLPKMRPTAADMSFFSQMVPTMNLGFYSETRPDQRNDI